MYVTVQGLSLNRWPPDMRTANLTRSFGTLAAGTAVARLAQLGLLTMIASSDHRAIPTFLLALATVGVAETFADAGSRLLVLPIVRDEPNTTALTSLRMFRDLSSVTAGSLSAIYAHYLLGLGFFATFALPILCVAFNRCQLVQVTAQAHKRMKLAAFVDAGPSLLACLLYFPLGNTLSVTSAALLALAASYMAVSLGTARVLSLSGFRIELDGLAAALKRVRRTGSFQFAQLVQLIFVRYDASLLPILVEPKVLAPYLLASKLADVPRFIASSLITAHRIHAHAECRVDLRRESLPTALASAVGMLLAMPLVPLLSHYWGFTGQIPQVLSCYMILLVGEPLLVFAQLMQLRKLDRSLFYRPMLGPGLAFGAYACTAIFLQHSLMACFPAVASLVAYVVLSVIECLPGSLRQATPQANLETGA